MQICTAPEQGESEEQTRERIAVIWAAMTGGTVERDGRRYAVRFVRSHVYELEVIPDAPHV